MAVRGNLREMPLTTLISVNCNEHNQAHLWIRRNGREAHVYFDQGQIAHVALDDEEGEEVFDDLLTWETGTFELDMDVPPPDRTVTTPWSTLVLDGMRRIDEDAADVRDHCPSCGCFVDELEKCHNPDCSEFSDGVEAWDEGIWVEETEIEQMEVDEMAELNELLRSMADDIPGFISADVVGMDGLSIAGYATDPDFDAEAASAQFALVMKLVQKTVGQLGDDLVEDNLVTSDNAYILTRFLGDGSYYLGVAVDKETASLGNVRLMTRQYADDLWETIPK